MYVPTQFYPTYLCQARPMIFGISAQACTNLSMRISIYSPSAKPARHQQNRIWYWMYSAILLNKMMRRKSVRIPFLNKVRFASSNYILRMHCYHPHNNSSYLRRFNPHNSPICMQTYKKNHIYANKNIYLLKNIGR